MPSKKKKYNARFPPARIKKIMQSDEEVGKVAQAVPVIISRALELFVENLLKKAETITTSRNAKTLTPSHLKQCIMAENRFDFLKDLVSAIPDTSQGEYDDIPCELNNDNINVINPTSTSNIPSSMSMMGPSPSIQNISTSSSSSSAISSTITSSMSATAAVKEEGGLGGDGEILNINFNPHQIQMDQLQLQHIQIQHSINNPSSIPTGFYVPLNEGASPATQSVIVENNNIQRQQQQASLPPPPPPSGVSVIVDRHKNNKKKFN